MWSYFSLNKWNKHLKNIAFLCPTLREELILCKCNGLSKFSYLKDMNLTARVGANLLVYSPGQGQHF